MRTEFLFIQEVLGVYTSLFLDTDELKMTLRPLRARIVSGVFEKRGPGWLKLFVQVLMMMKRLIKSRIYFDE